MANAVAAVPQYTLSVLDEKTELYADAGSVATPTFYPMMMVGWDPGGYLCSCDDTQVVVFAGVVADLISKVVQSADTTTTNLVSVHRGRFSMAIASTSYPTQGDVGKAVYAKDNQTVAYSGTVNANLVGYVYEVLSATAVLITPTGSAVTSISSTNQTLSGTLTVTGASTFNNTVTVNVASATAAVVGPNGTTNPATLKVNTNTASAATGLLVTSAAAASGVALAVISSGTNESGTLDAKGTGTLTLNGVGGTGAVQVGGAGSGANATGLKITPNSAASGVAAQVVSTGANEALTIDAKAAAAITLNGAASTATGVNIGSATAAAGTVLNVTSTGCQRSP